MLDKKKSTQEIIRDHLLRYYDYIHQNGLAKSFELTNEYAVYFENMFKDLYIRELENRLSARTTN